MAGDISGDDYISTKPDPIQAFAEPIMVCCTNRSDVKLTFIQFCIATFHAPLHGAVNYDSCRC
jgi:hypothetical protein